MLQRRRQMAIAEADGELDVDELVDPLGLGGDIAAAHRRRNRLRQAADLNDPVEAVEAGKTRRWFRFEISEYIVLDDDDVVLFSELQHAMGDNGGNRRPGRIMQPGGGQIEAGTMRRKNAPESLDVRPVRRERDADRLDAMGAQKRQEIEIAGIVDQYRIARLQQETAEQVERLRCRIGEQDLIGIGIDAALRQAPGVIQTQRGEAE